jgi:hypothetical protein
LRGMMLKHMPTNPVVDPVGCGGEIAHGTLPISPPPVPRQLSNARTVGLVPDKGKERSPPAPSTPRLKGRGPGNPHGYSSGSLNEGPAWETP